MIGVSTLHQAPKALEHKCFKTKHMKEISETQFQNRSTNQKHGATGEEMHHPTWLLPQMLPGHQPLWATACHLLQPVKETLMSNKVANSVKQRI
jgi:hypothetical protein